MIVACMNDLLSEDVWYNQETDCLAEMFCHFGFFTTYGSRIDG